MTRMHTLDPGRTRRSVGSLLTEEHGQSLVIMSLFMTVFIGMLGIVLDLGRGYISYREMQVAADAAAIAGARALADGFGESFVTTRAQELLAANGADTDLSIVTVTDGSQVTVEAKAEVETVFAKILGLDSISVSAEAKALYGAAAEADNLMPFVVEKDTWVFGETVELWGNPSGAGNFGWVHWSGQVPSTPTLQANIDDPSRSDTVHIGDQVSGHPGVSFNAVRNNLNAWIGSPVTVILYDPAEVTGAGANLKYVARGFARFVITSTVSQGANSKIYGYFVEYVGAGSEVDPTSTIGIKMIDLAD